MGKKTIKINLVDSYDTIEDKFLFHFLGEHYNFLVSEEPDFLFYSCVGEEFKKYKNCVKIFYTGENAVPNFNECDYAIGFDHIVFEDRYLRFPYGFEAVSSELNNMCDITKTLAVRKFCNFVYSNSSYGEGAKLRQEFCKKLMKYKAVDCPGKVLNNMENAINPRRDGNWSSGKIDFLKNYKFTIAFENTSSIGYTTEKLCQPLQARSVPIYWGNPEAARDFNPRAFINCHEYESLDKVIEKVIELDRDDEKYLEMLMQPPLNPGFEEKFSKETVANFLVNIVEKGNKPYFKNTNVWLKKPTLGKRIVQNIFSVKNKENNKVVKILGIELKFKRRIG
ncbi:alpha(1,3/1,4) fucosyltransferase [Candidatus Gastranaerophilus sp. (ex Termes propinquus)]|nr:alpha(1,3/1,4) fucosyltransferase [Candidatus Gastranaerophilus sp. (ex Termes propinquus)]